MTTLQPEKSPQFYARCAGLFYLVIIVAGGMGEMFIRNKLIVSGDAAATANNIASSPMLWRIGIAGDLVMHLCDLIVMFALYVLLRPVNKNLALLNLLFNLIQTAVLVANKMNLMIPLFLSEHQEYLKAFPANQLQSLAYLSIKAHGYGFGNGLLFFGSTLLIEGYLFRKSGYFPKTLGVLLQIAGICYLANSFTLILDPELAGKLFPAILMPALVAELSTSLWLAIKGVNMAAWNARGATIHG